MIRFWPMEDRGLLLYFDLKLLEPLYFRGDVRREIEREEQRVAEVSQNLERYKREIGNCQTAAREMRDEEARLATLHDRYMDEADRAEQQARLADQEAERLERECATSVNRGW